MIGRDEKGFGWENPLLMLAGVGLSYLGNWIYLIALNVSILNLTGSAAAVAGLYIIRPIASLLTNLWAGSVIDRVNKRRLMMTVDVIRGTLIVCIPFLPSLSLIYVLLLLINIAGSFFGPASTVYITKLVPIDKRKRFNSLMSLVNSGAFLLGPAMAGVLIMAVGTEVCIFINAATFLICAGFIYLLPNVDESIETVRQPLRLKVLLSDWRTIRQFAGTAKFFMTVYVLFQGAMLLGFALDSQEVTFIKLHLGLSDWDYGLITSLTGLGALIGAGVVAIIARKLPLQWFLGVGMFLTSVGYILFFGSTNFLTATLSYVFLGFFMAFANTGYATFFQNNVPIDIMGRFGSIADMVQGIIQIGLTLILGYATSLFSLQTVCLLFSIVGAVFSVGLLLAVLLPSKSGHFEREIPAKA